MVPGDGRGRQAPFASYEGVTGASESLRDGEVCSLILEPSRRGENRLFHPHLQGLRSFCHRGVRAGREGWQLRWAQKVMVTEGLGHAVESFDDR